MSNYQTENQHQENDWLARARTGDRQGFERIMRHHNQRLFRVARSILKDEHAAHDALQEGYIKAFQNLHLFRGPDGFASWLCRIVANEALQQLRTNKSEVPLDSVGADNVVLLDRSTPETAVANDQLKELIASAIDDLPQPFRTVFVMRSIEQMSGREVALVLGIPDATVKTRLHRAKLLLRNHFDRKMQAAQLSIFEFGGQHCDQIVAKVLARIDPPIPKTST